MSGGKLLQLRGLREAPRSVPRSRMDTMLLTPEGVATWTAPDFQRPLRVNAKVQAMAEELKGNGGVLYGIITLGIFEGEWYLVDGQHRIEAFKLSGLAEGICDVRICDFESLAEMADEFGRLNGCLVRMNPDDRLRALETSSRPLQTIRRSCPFIGYDSIRRGDKSPVVSMSMALRSWKATSFDTPTLPTGSVEDTARGMADDDAARLVDFFQAVHEAWGRDVEYGRLWLSLNLSLVGWLWRRVVLTRHSHASVSLTRPEFVKCATSLSANGPYLDYLVGRKLSDRDRSPAYQRIKVIFARRLTELGKPNARFPAPAWAASGGNAARRGAV